MRKMVSFCFYFGIFALSIEISTAGQAKPTALLPYQQRWVNYCVSFSEGFPDGIRTGNAKFAPAAKRKFSAMPRSEFRHRLEPCQVKLKKLNDWFLAGNQNDWAHGDERSKTRYQESCIAFTLAYFGVNQRENVHRFGGFAEADYAMRFNIYCKQPSDWLFRDIMTGSSDGAGFEVLQYVRHDLFCKFPGKVLLFYSKDQGQRNLKAFAMNLANEEYSSGTKQNASILLKEIHSHNQQIAHAARYCLKVYRNNH